MSFLLKNKKNIFLGFLSILILPSILFAQGVSSNYRLEQENVSFTELDGSSPNYEFKATIGEAIVGSSESGNYKLDQGKTWQSTFCGMGTVWNGSMCVVETSTGGSGSGGAGSSNYTSNTEAQFVGRAFPNSRVELLKDGQLVASTIAGADARFNISVRGFNIGNHNFSILGRDKESNPSVPVTYNLTLTEGVTTMVSGIYIAPTIGVDKKVVKQGENIAIFGQTTPTSTVTISVHSPEEFFRSTGSDSDGVFLYNFDTSILNKGTHETKAKSLSSGEISEFGQTASFEVGDVTILKDAKSCPQKGDLNNDCRVNIVDFSIAAFWYERELSNEFKLVESAVLNNDSKINIFDLSIIAFYWTG